MSLLKERNCALGIAVCEEQLIPCWLPDTAAATGAQSLQLTRDPGAACLALGSPMHHTAMKNCSSCLAKPSVSISAPFRTQAKKTPNPPAEVLRGKECFQISKRITRTIGTTEKHIKINIIVSFSGFVGHLVV